MIINDGQQAIIDNTAFIEKIKSTPEGAEKAASAMTDYVRTYIRELSFARKILPPKPVSPLDLVPQVNSDQPTRIVEMDQKTDAYAVTYVEGPQSRYFQGKKFQVFYNRLESERFTKATEEIMTYRTPIKTIVQENYLKDLQIMEDRMFINAVESICQANYDKDNPIKSQIYKAVGPFTPAILTEGLKMLAGKEVPIGTILISEMDFLDLGKLVATTGGSGVMENIIVEGYSYTKLLGHNFIRSLKNDIVKPGNIYMFTTPDYLGVFDVLTDVKAYVKQEGPMLDFYLWETIGMAIANTNGVAKIELKAS